MQNKEMSHEIIRHKNSRDSTDAHKHERFLEKVMLVQQRKSLIASNIASKAFLSYHEIAPALTALANHKRSSIPPALVPELTKQVKRFSIQKTLRANLQARRLSKRISQSPAATSRTSRISAASKDWELKLINGLLGDNDTQKHTDSEEWRRFTLTGFSNENESLELTLPEAVPLPPSPKLDIQNLSAKSCLRVVQAVEISEEILDEFDYDSCSEISEVDARETDFHNFAVSGISPYVSSESIPEIKLEPESWPLPADGSIPSILSPTTPLPDPLRCNPPERAIAKSRSHQTLRSVRSNCSNRKAFIMQQNDSSISVHSLGTTTTKSISDFESALETETSSRNVHNKNRKFPLHIFGHLKRTNASQAVIGIPMLTPVAETFEKTRKGSVVNIQAEIDQVNGESAQSSITEKKTSRFIFQGALVRRGSRRSARRLP